MSSIQCCSTKSANKQSNVRKQSVRRQSKKRPRESQFSTFLFCNLYLYNSFKQIRLINNLQYNMKKKQYKLKLILMFFFKYLQIEEKEIYIEPSRDFTDQLRQLKILGKYKKDLAIKVKNFESYFKIDLWFTLEQEMRDLSNITTIVFDNCKLSKEHLKVLKGHVLFQGNKFIRLIFSQNNLSDIDMDYFIFGNSETISRQIQSNYISLYIINNYGLFKDQFIQKLRQKFDKNVLISKDDGVISFNLRGTEDQEYKNFQFFRLSVMKCIKQSIHIIYDEGDQFDKNNSIKRKTTIQKQRAISNNHVEFLKQLEEETDQEDDYEDDNPERCLETIIDILLPQDQVNPLEKLDLGYLDIKNVNLLKKLWSEVAQCSSIRLAYLHHLQDYVIDSLAMSISKRKIHVQKIEFTSSKMNPWAFQLIMKNISAEKIVLADCGLTDEHFENFNIQLKSNKRLCRQLMHLDISKNSEIGAKSMKELGEYLKKFENLQKIMINNCDITDNMIVQFTAETQNTNSFQQFNLLKCLETLELKENQNITQKGYSRLFKFLYSFQKFSTLSLQDNNISSEIITDMINSQPFFLKLKSINLSQNRFIDQIAWEKFMEMLSESTNLTNLYLSDCLLTDEKANGIFQSLINVKSNIWKCIKHLDISNNPFSQQQSHFVLSSFLMKCLNLETLNLTDAKISHENYMSLTDLLEPKLEVLQNLKTLILSDNQDISEEGWESIFCKLKDLEYLKSLDISKCQLTPRICKKIWGQLGQKCYLYKSLSSLNLSFNSCINEGWEYIASCLRYFDRIHTLDLTQTIYSNKDLFLIEKAFTVDKNQDQQIEMVVDNIYPLQKCVKRLIFAQNTSPTHEGWDCFWRFLSKFQQLEEIDLSTCLLQEDKVANLSTIAKDAPFLKTLEIVSFYGNSHMQLVGWICLFDCLILCQSLGKIDLSSCILTNVKILAISKMISQQKSMLKHSLRNIILNGNDKIGSLGYKKLLQTITGRMGTKKLSLENKRSRSVGEYTQDSYYEDIKDHLFAINKLPHELQKLHLDKNVRITPQELGHLFRQISMFEHITEISLQKCYLNDKKIESMLKPLMKEQSNPLKLSLQSVNFSGNTKITFAGWQKLFQTLSSFPSIQKIYLSNCNLADQQIKFIAETIKSKEHLLKNITDLDLSYNQKMNQKSLQLLFSVLADSMLSYLSLSNCDLDDKKFKPFLNALKKSSLSNYLATLDLSKNPKISPLNWKIFFYQLNSMDAIAYLNLQYCCMNSERLTFLQNQLNNNSSTLSGKIRSLELLGSHKVKDVIWEQIFKSFKNCMALENIGLEFCNLNQKTSEQESLLTNQIPPKKEQFQQLFI